MTEWDDERASITGRKVDANIPPTISKSPRLPWWLILFAGVPAALLMMIFFFARSCSR